MLLRSSAEVFSPLVIVAVLVAIIWFSTAGNPDARAALPWLFGAGLTFMFVAVGVGHLKDRRKERRIQEKLDRLISLRHSDSGGAAQEAEELFFAVCSKHLRPYFETTEGLVEAASNPGPQQIACLRLAIRNTWTAEEPWVGILRQHEEILRAADLKPHEAKRLTDLLRPGE